MLANFFDAHSWVMLTVSVPTTSDQAIECFVVISFDGDDSTDDIARVKLFSCAVPLTMSTYTGAATAPKSERLRTAFEEKQVTFIWLHSFVSNLLFPPCLCECNQASTTPNNFSACAHRFGLKVLPCLSQANHKKCIESAKAQKFTKDETIDACAWTHRQATLVCEILSSCFAACII